MATEKNMNQRRSKNFSEKKTAIAMVYASTQDSRWTKKILVWWPRNQKRKNWTLSSEEYVKGQPGRE